MTGKLEVLGTAWKIPAMTWDIPTDYSKFVLDTYVRNCRSPCSCAKKLTIDLQFIYRSCVLYVPLDFRVIVCIIKELSSQHWSDVHAVCYTDGMLKAQNCFLRRTIGVSIPKEPSFTWTYCIVGGYSICVYSCLPVPDDLVRSCGTCTWLDLAPCGGGGGGVAGQLSTYWMVHSHLFF
jgi:hypothetical protein